LRLLKVFLVLALFTSTKSFAGTVVNTLPDKIDPQTRYLFYSHGYIVEGENTNPVHPRWGEYDYPGILDTLTGLSDVVISTHRPKNTDPFEHARWLKTQVIALIEKGVPAHNISLVGFSRGGFITAIASSYLHHVDLNYAILAACTSGLAQQSDIILYGNVLSIYEESDSVGSCVDLVKRKPEAVREFKEVSISTGLEHGAFYQPISQWIKPLKAWLATRSPAKAFTLPRSQQFTMTASNTQRSYSISVHLPRSYSQNVAKHYPVIVTTDAPYSFPNIVGASRLPVNTGNMQEAIIVGIGYSKGDKGVTSRVRDYTPAIADSWKLETGGAQQYLEFIKNDLLTFIDAKYRVNPNKRIFVGHSLGGLFGAYTLFNAPDTFSDFILGSPSVWFNNHFLLNQQLKKPSSAKNVYISVGSLETPAFGEGQDMVEGSTSLVEKLQNEGNELITVRFEIVQGASHHTVFPTLAVQGLSWILEAR